MDEMILKTQQWLNDTYSGNSGYVALDLSESSSVRGKTGWTTIYALTRALQIELGITATANNFGNTTISKFKSRFPNGITQQPEDSTEEDNIYAIVQGALWCKGYSAVYGEITKYFKSSVASSIKQLKEDAGLSNENATISVDLMKALLSMDQFVLLNSYGGTEEIRTIQQTLNATYPDYIGIIPCDGLYGGSMNKALIKVLQAVEGLSVSQANGNFGPTTTAKLSNVIIQSGASGESVKLFRYALACNGYSTGSFSNSWDSSLAEVIRSFQEMYALPITGIGDKNTWMSLLTSKGNPDRSSTACDCSTILDSEKAESLYDAGYRYVGRYLTGTVSGTTSKAMTRTEVESILDAGLKIFPIFQEGTPSLNRYTVTEGISEGQKAFTAARNLGIPEDTIIYFAIDYDVMDGQIGFVKDYFTGINSIFRKANYYRVGIYGPRNVCTQICNSGLAVSSFVSDMSTGFSGNLGYPIPENWAFDQFCEYTFSHNNVSFDLDKDAFSGRYTGFDSLNEGTTLPDVGIFDRIDYARDLLRILGIEIVPNDSFIFGYEYKIIGTYMDISYKVSYNKSEADDSDTNTTIDVVNGTLSQSVGQAMETVYGQLGDEYTVNIGVDKVFAMTSLALKIENGSLKISAGVDTNENLVLKIKAEQILRADEEVTYSQYYEVTYTLKPYDGDTMSDVSEYSYATVKDVNWAPYLLLAGVVIFATVVTVVTVGVGASAVVPFAMLALTPAIL